MNLLTSTERANTFGSHNIEHAESPANCSTSIDDISSSMTQTSSQRLLRLPASLAARLASVIPFAVCSPRTSTRARRQVWHSDRATPPMWVCFPLSSGKLQNTTRDPETQLLSVCSFMARKQRFKHRDAKDLASLEPLLPLKRTIPAERCAGIPPCR
jgi:hypothetical protein